MSRFAERAEIFGSNNVLSCHITPTHQDSPLVKIVDVKCPNCSRSFRTVPAVVEHAGSVYCSVCGTLMVISAPQPINVLRPKPDAA